MLPLIRIAPLALAAGVLFASANASAQPTRVEIHDPFYEGGRFTTRNLQLQGRGPSLELKRGGRVDATLDIFQDCRNCGASANQIIVGIGGEPSAQACVYSGPGRAPGWSTARFSLAVPDMPGIYEVRARYAQAWGCEDAIGWWRTDRPRGPGPDATIGVIVVLDDAPRPRPVPSTRPVNDIQRDLDATLTRLDDVNAEMEALVAKPGNGARMRALRGLVKQSSELTYQLQDLNDELADALWALNPRGPERPSRPERPVRPGRPGRPGGPGHPDDRRPAPIVPPQIVVIGGAPVGPMPLPDGEMRDLLARVDKAAFAEYQQNAIRDAMMAGAYFNIGQALALMAKFAHEGDRVDVAATLCPRIVEVGALPRLLDAFVFESYKQELRDRTKNQCGWLPPVVR